MNAKHWSIETALKQIRKCDFECEAGPLANNVAWRWLEAVAEDGPTFWPGQGVWYQIDAEGAGKTLTQWVLFYIVGCHMGADNERRLWTYDLSYDPIAPWHNGAVHFRNVDAKKLALVQPEQEAA